jgi:hypothetical protein
MLEQIRQYGPEELRTAAAEAMARSDTIRSERIAVQSRLASGEMTRPESAVSEPAVVGRRVYDAGGAEVLPGTLARGDADPLTGDAAVDEAFAGAGLTYFFYRDEYGRNSIDDRGMAIDSRSTSAAASATPSGTAGRWSTATATANCSPGSPRTSTSSPTSSRTA